MPQAIEATEIGRRDRKSGDWLIRGVSVAIGFGERLGVLGPSGAGKTVLLRAMARLDPLDEGSIRWQGRVVQGEGVPDYRKRVVYLHQRPALLEGTVEDNLRYPFTLRAHRDRSFDPAPPLTCWHGWAATPASSPRAAATSRAASPSSSA